MYSAVPNCGVGLLIAPSTMARNDSTGLGVGKQFRLGVACNFCANRRHSSRRRRARDRSEMTRAQFDGYLAEATTANSARPILASH